MRPSAVPARPPRDLRLDVVRGWLQLQIFASHAYGSFIGAWLIHAGWGISDSSEQFVLLSGFALGSVFTLKLLRDGMGAASADLLRRTLRLYRTHLLVFFAFAAMVFWAAMALPLPEGVARMGWSWLAERPWVAVPAAFTLAYQPAFMGILPIFICCMLLLPGFVWLLQRLGDAALALPIGLYLAVQLWGLEPPSLGGTGIAFNPLSWQLLFLLGVWAGRRRLLHGAVLPCHPALLGAAALMLLAGLWLRLVDRGWLPDPGLDAVALFGKEALAPLRLLHALACAWLVACLLPREMPWMRGRFGQALAAAGRNSLAVFCLGLFLSYGAATAFRLLPGEMIWLDPLLISIGALVLFGFAHRL